ncbi:MAG: hypothetical protein JNK73_02985 [Bacteroidia bacterium]|nr:hypothetical protein [Bacteroidia bacterium]
MAAFTLSAEPRPTVSSIKQLFEFLSDFGNFKSILPDDKVENFTYDKDSCSFNIKGITPMSIRLAEKKPYETLFFSSEGLSKFNFKLRVNFKGEAEQTGTSAVEMQGDLNPFILKMAEKSLLALVNSMNQKLSQLQIQTP